MKFNFGTGGDRQPAEASYRYAKASLPDQRFDLRTALLLAHVDATPSGLDVFSAIRGEIRSADRALITRLALAFAGDANFRDLAFLLTAELAAAEGNDPETGLLVERIVHTPFDIPLWLQHYAFITKQRPDRVIRKHLGILFNQLDEYQFSRCGRRTQLMLREALRRLRPKAAGQAKKILFGRILRDHIPARTTWEQEWRALYQLHYDSLEQRQVMLRDKWKEGISSFRIGYTPLLENLSTMLCTGVSGKVLKLAAEYLGNGAAVKRSGIHPLRLLEVYRSFRSMEKGGAGMLTEALEKATPHTSWGGLEWGRKGVSVIAMDVSNSMKQPLRGGGVQRFDVGPLLAALWKNRGDRLITGIIGNTWKPVAFQDRPILHSVDEFRRHEGEAGYALNAWLILQDLLRKNQIVDRVLIFTDCRLWDRRTYHQAAGCDIGNWWRRYRDLVAPRAKLYLFDLAGYASKRLECLEDDVFLVAGWNDSFFVVLDELDS